MLLGLTIRDVVLIDRLDLAFQPGLCVLTGETGAGKSILLDALGLALGVRAESGLVRPGADQAVVSAEFAVDPRHPVRERLSEAGIECEGDTLVLRRIVNADGRSRAFIDDQPTSVGLLRQVGECLVEIEVQFAGHGLLDAATHREMLDAYGGHEAALAATRRRWESWRQLTSERVAADATLAATRAEEDFLRHALAELDGLDPKPAEEKDLSAARALLQQSERFIEAVEGALAELRGDHGSEHALHAAARQLDRLRDKAMGRLDPALAALERAAIETRDAIDALEAEARALIRDTGQLERIEERLFALRALARKHSVVVEALPDLRAAFAAKIATLDDGGARAKALARREAEARDDFIGAADVLSRARRRAAKSLDEAMKRELPPLRLEKARFATVIAPLGEEEWGTNGVERTAFEVATIPGAPTAPLQKIASGGELARFMLALNLVLARTSQVPTLVFDEVDSGVGGAVAAAVGERLHRLGRERQVLVVTHSPQVAARGAHHLRVAKVENRRGATTRVDALDPAERREEIARMLSGASITAEARAAAASLIAGAAP
jgi:DNA repair protein RecN (Recombination protein N)